MPSVTSIRCWYIDHFYKGKTQTADWKWKWKSSLKKPTMKAMLHTDVFDQFPFKNRLWSLLAVSLMWLLRYRGWYLWVALLNCWSNFSLVDCKCSCIKKKPSPWDYATAHNKFYRAGQFTDTRALFISWSQARNHTIGLSGNVIILPGSVHEIKVQFSPVISLSNAVYLSLPGSSLGFRSFCICVENAHSLLYLAYLTSTVIPWCPAVSSFLW